MSRNDAATQRKTQQEILLRALRRCVNYSLLLLMFTLLQINSFSQRQDILLNNDWLTSLNTTNTWKKVTIPHNWDDYYGYRRLVHGNLHGDAVYKKSFVIKQSKQGKRFFLFFEGVGSYATVYVNDKLIGSHNGGRTSFTLDVTDALKTDGSQNNLLVKASHPSFIKDLPWVCGGCSDERGFSEGSQPMGIFRPVHLIITNDIRIEPFGVHAWSEIKDGLVDLFINTTIKNYSKINKKVKITHLLVDPLGNSETEFYTDHNLHSCDSVTLAAKRRMHIPISFLKLWSTEKPYLYKIITTVTEGGVVVDKVETDFGFRTINWKTPTNQFLLNNKPVFINGTGEYEHLLGQSHAFSKEQIVSRMKWVKAAGFNAFRDAHQPHNLLYGQLCNQMGILWWTQFSAHIWYDSPEFRNSFKQLLKEWVIERRNDPSVILWGLQNESKLPEDFAKECTELIRSLDPTSSSQRLVTTCNGGSGTDWDVPQNWTGTYGGDPNTYASDVKKQVLIGEYGAWRTIDLHTEDGFNQNGALSEDRMTQLMEQKIRLAESVKDSCAGQFFWLLTSHDNPGRVQGGEGLRELDRIGPVNYKGLLTPWEEPADVFYMFRSNYASKRTSPMVYIVSHTWPNRWTTTGKKDGITVYSNCDEVELFNDIGFSSLGKQTRKGIGTHFQWNGVDINYNVLYAVGYVNGKVVARDTIILNHLPSSPHFNALFKMAKPILKPQPGYHYIYQVNCGGPEYKDEYGNVWSADRLMEDKHGHDGWGSSSWTKQFAGMPGYFASQRRTFDPIKGTKDWGLFQDFRYGKDQLQYEFELPAGAYLVEFYFIEPWLGIGGGIDASGMRLFDVAIDGKTIWKDVDIWKEAGTNTAFKKTTTVYSKGGKLRITFPKTKSGQALISAIAIASRKKNIHPGSAIGNLSIGRTPGQEQFPAEVRSWLDIGDKIFTDSNVHIRLLAPALFGAEWLCVKSKLWDGQMQISVFTLSDVYVAISSKTTPAEKWLQDFEDTRTILETDAPNDAQYKVYRKRVQSGIAMTLHDPAASAPPVVMLVPVATMAPAFDLKTTTPYRTDVAFVSTGVTKENFAGRECAVIKSNDKVSVEWPVQTGVADVYAITVKYFYPNEQPLQAKIQLIGSGNTMMLEEPVSFTFTRPDKWNQFTINTGNMINAGNYIVRLIIENAEGLAISGIEVQ